MQIKQFICLAALLAATTGGVNAQRLIEQTVDSAVRPLTLKGLTNQGRLVELPSQPRKAPAGALTIPYSEDFSTNVIADGTFTNIECLGGNNPIPWRYDETGFVKLYCGFYGYDSWLITPALSLEKGKIYEVSLDVWAYKRYSSPAEEQFEIKLGTEASVAGMTIDVLGKTKVTALYDLPATETSSFTVPATGIYYLGIHGVSEGANPYMYLNADNLKIETTSVEAAPAAIENLTLTPDIYGAKSVEISFNAPSLTFDGEAISALSAIELKRDGNLVHTFTAPAPGSALSFTDSGMADGEHIYSVVSTSPAGQSLPTSATTFVGFSNPATPTGVTLVENPNQLGEVTISWNPVTTDVNGKIFPEGTVKYYIANAQRVIVQDLTNTTFTYNAMPYGQDFVFYGVFAMTDFYGYSDSYGRTDFIPVGVPYEAPFIESFPNGEVTYEWGLDSRQSAEGSDWGTLVENGEDDGFLFPSFDGDNGCGGAGCMNTGDTTWLMSPKIDISKAANPYVSFAYWCWGNNYRPDTFRAFIREVGTTQWNQLTEVLTTVEGDSRWVRLFIPIYEYRGKQVQVAFSYTMDNHFYGMIDAIKVYHVHDHDLAVTSINAPAMVKVGEEHTVSASVENMGIANEADYTVRLLINGKVAQTLPGTEIALGETAHFTFTNTLGVNNPEESIYTVDVICNGDGNLADNTSKPSTLTVRFPNYPAVTDLACAPSEGGFTLTWGTPDTSNPMPETTNEGFEDYRSFAIDNVGRWTLIDNDGEENYPLDDIEFTHNGEAFAYIVMDGKRLGREAMMGHTGAKSMASIASTANLNDDWLISPELWAGEQTITFYAKSCIGYYGLETFNFLYSTTGTSPYNFRLLEQVDEVPTTWTKYSFKLPAGTKYFAIQCVSINMYMLMVDDIEYIDATSPIPDLSIIGYNIYRDNEKVNSQPIASNTFTDAAPAGTHIYNVSTVYVAGESVLSNTVSTDGSGLDSISVDTDAPAEYFNLQGMRISRPQSGAYILRQGSKTSKIIR